MGSVKIIMIPLEGHTNLTSLQRDFGNKVKRQGLYRLPIAALISSYGQGTWTREMPVLDFWQPESESELLQAVLVCLNLGVDYSCLFLLLVVGGPWLAGVTPIPLLCLHMGFSL